VPYRQGSPPAPTPCSRVEHRFHGKVARFFMGAAVVVTLGAGVYAWPEAVADRTLRCVRSEGACSLDVDQSILGTRRETFPLSGLHRLRMPSNEDHGAPRWEVVLATTHGNRRLLGCQRGTECTALVERVSRFMSGSEEILEVHEPCSPFALAFLVALVAGIASFPLLGLLRRVSLSFDWDARLVEVRRHPFGGSPVTLSLEGSPKATIREERREGEGEEVIRYEIVLDTRDRDLALGFGALDAQLAFVREVNGLLAAHLPR
jgi:hypothetical protein